MLQTLFRLVPKRGFVGIQATRFRNFGTLQDNKDELEDETDFEPDPNLIETENDLKSTSSREFEENVTQMQYGTEIDPSIASHYQDRQYSGFDPSTHTPENVENFLEISDVAQEQSNVSNKRQLTKDERQKQREVWNQIRTTLDGMWNNLESIDNRNIARTDKMYSKLNELSTLHVKNVQQSLQYLSFVNNDIEALNDKLDKVFNRLSDLEENASNEWFEWRVPKYEIPFKEGTYLRSQGYEVGSMVWCIELRWELAKNETKLKQSDAKLDNEKGNPILNMTDDNGNSDDNNENDENDRSIENRLRKGYHELGIYVSPRSVSNWEQLSSLKAKCQVRINDTNEMNGEKLHFDVSGDFLRGQRLVSWGKTLPKGDLYFGNKMNQSQQNNNNSMSSMMNAAINDENEIYIKLRINSQTMSYKTDINSNVSNQQRRQRQNDEINTKNVENDNKYMEEMNRLCTMPLDQFWKEFDTIKGLTDAKLAKLCDGVIDAQLILYFRKGPLNENTINELSLNDENEASNDVNDSKATKKRKEKQRKILKARHNAWNSVCQFDKENGHFRQKLANILIKYNAKKSKLQK